jgi:hypothetical protein
LLFFASYYGTRYVASEKDAESTAVAMESILKLFSLIVGLCYLFCFDGFDDIYQKAASDFDKKIRLAALQTESTGFPCFIHVCYFPLPRQFHTAIVENNKETHIAAIWLFRCTYYFSTFCFPNSLGHIF